MSMNESERVKREKEITDKIIQKLPASGNYMSSITRLKTLLL